jgi:hypothetical protein
MVINGGAHPVFEAQARLVDLECLAKIDVSTIKTVEALHVCDTRFNIPVIAPGRGGTIGQLPQGEGAVRRFNVFWLARNGNWLQRLRLAKIDGNWRSASQVIRGEEILLEELPPDFPKDALA